MRRHCIGTAERAVTGSCSGQIITASRSIQQPRLSKIKIISTRQASSIRSSSPYGSGPARFARYENNGGAAAGSPSRNPLNYIDNERGRLQRNQYHRKRMIRAGWGLAVCLALQGYLLYAYRTAGNTTNEDTAKPKPILTASRDNRQRLDSLPNKPSADLPVKVIQSKPGVPDIKVDEYGNELVETGTSTIPHFPRFIKVASSTASPAAQPVSSVAGRTVEEGQEEYQLLGLGIRTVSFLSIQVYVLGLYVRTTDLDRLQAAFVRHVNPAGSSLIPSEKEQLKKDLLSDDQSLEIWNKVLLETGVRSAVRIVPTRGTDFAHLRDGWVRGITARSQEASRKYEGKSEFDAPGFGESVGEFKQVLGGKGKAPKGSMVLLTRDERGVLRVLFEPEKSKGKDGVIINRSASELLGQLADERISRQVWLGYLGGKNVSSAGARKSIVDGVMELVERPVGTVGTQVS